MNRHECRLKNIRKSKGIIRWLERFGVVVDCFYIYMALFSTRKQIHRALVACDSKWMTVAFLQCTLNIHPRGVVAELFGSCMPGATWNCCYLGAFCVLRMSLCTFLWPLSFDYCKELEWLRFESSLCNWITLGPIQLYDCDVKTFFFQSWFRFDKIWDCRLCCRKSNHGLCYFSQKVCPVY